MRYAKHYDHHHSGENLLNNSPTCTNFSPFLTRGPCTRGTADFGHLPSLGQCNNCRAAAAAITWRAEMGGGGGRGGGGGVLVRGSRSRLDYCNCSGRAHNSPAVSRSTVTCSARGISQRHRPPVFPGRRRSLVVALYQLSCPAPNLHLTNDGR